MGQTHWFLECISLFIFEWYFHFSISNIYVILLSSNEQCKLCELKKLVKVSRQSSSFLCFILLLFSCCLPDDIVRTKEKLKSKVHFLFLLFLVLWDDVCFQLTSASIHVTSSDTCSSVLTSRLWPGPELTDKGSCIFGATQFFSAGNQDPVEKSLPPALCKRHNIQLAWFSFCDCHCLCSKLWQENSFMMAALFIYVYAYVYEYNVYYVCMDVWIRGCIDGCMNECWYKISEGETHSSVFSLQGNTCFIRPSSNVARGPTQRYLSLHTSVASLLWSLNARYSDKKCVEWLTIECQIRHGSQIP